MEIKVLGTVSPYPKENNNCPGFLVSDDKNKIMLDCGTGSSRMLDMYKDLRNLAIIISHYHPDHYADIFSIAYASYLNKKMGYLDKKIQVYLPKIEKQNYMSNGWTSPYYTGDDPYNFITSAYNEKYMNYMQYDQKSVYNIGNMYVEFCSNPHDIKSYSIKIISGDGVLVYSSDTGYADNCLERFAKDADVFICESTFLKGQVRVKDTHLFAHEVAQIAAKANVKNLYLFHTYPEMEKERYREEAKEYFDNVNILNEGDIITLKKGKLL